VATHGVIAATSQAMLGLSVWAPATDPRFSGTAFSPYGSGDLQRPMSERLTVSLHPFPVAVNGTLRKPPTSAALLGRWRRPALPQTSTTSKPLKSPEQS
jgi:hypothetical protein